MNQAGLNSGSRLRRMPVELPALPRRSPQLRALRARLIEMAIGETDTYFVGASLGAAALEDAEVAALRDYMQACAAAPYRIVELKQRRLSAAQTAHEFTKRREVKA